MRARDWQCLHRPLIWLRYFREISKPVSGTKTFVAYYWTDQICGSEHVTEYWQFIISLIAHLKPFPLPGKQTTSNPLRRMRKVTFGLETIMVFAGYLLIGIVYNAIKTKKATNTV